MKTVTRPQLKKLESLLFWRRELHLLKNYNALEYELNEVRNNISYVIEEMDKLEIPYSIQNDVLNYPDVHTDILDVLKENNIKLIK